MNEKEFNRLVNNITKAIRLGDSTVLTGRTCQWIADNAWLTDYKLKGQKRVKEEYKNQIINDLAGNNLLSYICSDYDLLYAWGWLVQWYQKGYHTMPNLSEGTWQSFHRFHLRGAIINAIRNKIELKVFCIDCSKTEPDGRQIKYSGTMVRARDIHEAARLWRMNRNKDYSIRRIEATDYSPLFLIPNGTPKELYDLFTSTPKFD